MAPHRNAISKCYVTCSKMRDLKSGDAIVFYRSGGMYKGVASTIGLVEKTIIDIPNEEKLIEFTHKRTVFDQNELRKYFRSRLSYSKDFRPFIINFLYVAVLKKRPNLEKLIKLGVIDKAPWGIVKISKEAFKLLINDNL